MIELPIMLISTFKTGIIGIMMLHQALSPYCSLSHIKVLNQWRITSPFLMPGPSNGAASSFTVPVCHLSTFEKDVVHSVSKWSNIIIHIK